MITYLKNVRLVSKDHLALKELSEIYDMIKNNPGIKLSTRDLREWQKSNNFKKGTDEELDKKHRDLKSNLPAFISSGEFNYANNNGCDLYYGYITIDVDKLPISPRILIKTVCEEDKSVCMAFISPSGDGAKFIHYLDYRGLDKDDWVIFHQSAFTALKTKYQDKWSVAVDESCIDLSRKCFISYDEEAYWNPNPVKFNWGFDLKEEKKKYQIEEKSTWYVKPLNYNPSKAVSVITDIIAFLNKEHITFMDEYENWIKVAFAILSCNLDLETAEVLFRGLSKTSRKYNTEDFDKKWRNLVATYNPSARKPAGIGTIIWLARNSGYELKRVKNNDSEAFFLWVITQLEEDKKIIRNNAINGLEILVNNRWEGLTDEDLAQITILNLLGKITKENLRDILVSYAPKYDPIESIHEKIKEWDGIDYLTQLFETLELTYPEDREIAYLFLKKWLIGIINTLYNLNPLDAYNENVFTLIGDQFIGKSRWIRRILPEELYAFYAEGDLSPKDKDNEKRACTNIIWFMDELANVISNKVENGEMKSFLSRPLFKFRSPYGMLDKTWHRMASFAGTSNDSKILTDLTGNRRYWIVEIKRINSEHNVNILGLWSQIYHLWESGEVSYMSKAENDNCQRHNERFRTTNVYEEIIYGVWQPEGTGEPERLNSSMIIKILNDHHGYKIDLKMAAFLGRTLTKMDFKEERRHGDNKYYLMWNREKERVITNGCSGDKMAKSLI